MITKKYNKSKINIFNVFCIIFIIYITHYYLIAAEYIHPCRKSDPQFNSCIKETFNHLRPYLINGMWSYIIFKWYIFIDIIIYFVSRIFRYIIFCCNFILVYIKMFDTCRDWRVKRASDRTVIDTENANGKWSRSGQGEGNTK